jgi:hypothetical protein
MQKLVERQTQGFLKDLAAKFLEPLVQDQFPEGRARPPGCQSGRAEIGAFVLELLSHIRVKIDWNTVGPALQEAMENGDVRNFPITVFGTWDWRFGPGEEKER